MPGIFLSAEWRHLAILSFEVDPAILKKRVPAGTEIDFFNGKALVSIVGFMFSKTRVLGVPVPFHTTFPELNLRFYVKREHPGGRRRAVTFVKELVPRLAVACIARALYNENYTALPMQASLTLSPNFIRTCYQWKIAGRWQELSMQGKGVAEVPPKDSEGEFLTDLHWGYAAQTSGCTMEYHVAHPPWRTWAADGYTFDGDVAAMYGNEFAPFLQAKPVSAILAEGSAITLSKGVCI